MKTFTLAILAFLSMSSAQAYDVLVPANIPLNNLPKDAYLYVVKEIRLTHTDNGLEGYGDFRFEFSRTERILVYPTSAAGYKSLKEGTRLSIQRYKFGKSTSEIKFRTPENNDGLLWSFGDLYSPTVTAGDFHRVLGEKIRLMYEDPDPYPGIDKSIVTDVVMNKITTAIKNGDYIKAIPHFQYLEKNETSLPESFYFYYAETLEKSGQKDEAKARAIEYMRRYGKKGKFYSSIVDLMGRL